FDDGVQNRWQLVSPDSRAGPGVIVAGPQQVPDDLPFPVVRYYNASQDNDPVPFTIQVCDGGNPYLDGAWVTLVKVDGTTMDEGVTDETSGMLSILGATELDSLQVVSLDGTRSAAKSVPQAMADGIIDLSITGRSRQSQTNVNPYVRLWPTTTAGSLDGIRLTLLRTAASDNLSYAVTGHNGIGAAANIPFDSDSNQHQVEVGFIPLAQAGFARVQGSHGGQFVELNVDYRLQAAQQNQ
ncbi:MAG: hypothetical protein AAF629_32755, partial [Chloroflexota bacterium]